MAVDRGEMAGRDHSSGIPACEGLRRAAMSICSWISSRGAPGLLGLAAIETELSNLLDGRRVDLRTAQELSRYFRDEVVRTTQVQYAA